MAGDIDKALSLFSRIEAVMPGWAPAINAIGALYMEKDDYESAESYLLKALKNDANSPSALYNLARLRQLQHRNKEALELYEGAIRNDESLCMAWNNLGALLLEEGGLHRAVDVLERAVICDHGLASAWNNLGVALERSGKLDKAADSFSKAIAIDPGYCSALFNLGALFHRMGCFDQAREHLEKVLTVEPENVSASFLLETMGVRPAGETVPVGHVIRLFDEAAGNFEEILTKELDYQTPELLYEMAEPFLKDGASVLDLGCGTGLGSQLYRKRASSLIGVDISKKMLEEAALKKHYDELLCFDIGTPWPLRKMFDLVYSTDVFVYFGRLSGLLNEIHNHLLPGGVLCFSVEKAEPESENGSSFILGPSGRYAHTFSCVSEALNETGFTLLDSSEKKIRKEAGRPVTGLLFVAVRDR